MIQSIFCIGDRMIDQNLHDRLKQVNVKLTELEKNLLQKISYLDKQLRDDLRKSKDGIIDYELEVTIDCYVSDESEYPICSLNEYLKGASLPENKSHLKIDDGVNHNEFEFRDNHPLKNDQHCWLFHCLYDHEHLNWEDIANIKYFWMDILPRYQYRIDMGAFNPFALPSKHIIYSDNYHFQINDMVRQLFPNFFDDYPIDLMKFQKINYNLREHIVNLSLEPIGDNELSVFHTHEYLSSLKTDVNAIESVVTFSIPSFITVSMANKYLIDSVRTIVSGTVYSAELALKTGWAINIGGGFHHAQRNSGGGFCFFNDYAIATHRLRQTNPNLKILYIDLDAHLGNGVLEFAGTTDNFHILDIYNTFSDLGKDYSLKPDTVNRFTLIGLQSYTGDKVYLELLKDHLPSLIDSIQPDMLFFNGGSDVLKGDPLGYLAITPQGMIERDLFVFREAKNRSIPILMCLSGGYGKDNYRHVINSLEAIITLMKN